MANFNWNAGTSGDWNLATNWTEGLIPNDAAAAVTIPFVAGPGYTVTIAAGASDTVQTLDLNSNLVVNGTLTFAPGSTGNFGHDYEGSVVTMTNGTIVNAGLVYAHVDTYGTVQFKGTNPTYFGYELQVHDGTTTVDTASIGPLKGTQLFDGIFEVMGAGRVFNFGGAGGGLKVDIESLTGPTAAITPNFFSQLIYDNAGSQINEWNGTAYVPVESTLKLIDNAAFVTVTGGRDYTTAGPLTIGKDGMFEQAGGTLTTGGLTLLAGGVFSGGISTTNLVGSIGQVIVKGAVVNNGQIVSGGPGIVFRDGLSGTGEITFNRTVPLPGWLHGEVVAAVPGILEVNGVGAGQTVKMIGNDTLILDNVAAFDGSIVATGTGNVVALTGVARAGAVVTSGANEAVTVTIGAKTIHADHVQQLRFSDTTLNVGSSGDPLVFPAPVNGVAVTDLSSADIYAVLSRGGSLSFIGGTETVMLTDSSLSVGPDTNAATVQRLYEGLLGRGADTGGMSYWNDQLGAGLGKAALANALLSSPESIVTNGTQSDPQFVTALYQGVLGRPAEAGGSAYWTGQLGQGLSRGDLAVALADSDEAKAHLASTTARIYMPDAAGTLVHELFETGLGREVDLPSLTYFKSALATLSPPEFAAAIASSAEFMGGHGAQTNDAYVNSLYQAGLGRPADPGGLAGWTNALNAGASRSDVLLAIGTSAEAGAHLTHNLSV